MHDILKYNREFYSTDQPKREVTALQRVELSEYVPILFYTPSTSTFNISEFLPPEIRELIFKALSGFLDRTTTTKVLERFVRTRHTMRSIEQSSSSQN